MSDIRNPSNLRLNRLPSDTQKGDVSRADTGTAQPAKVETAEPHAPSAPATGLQPTHMLADTTDSGSSHQSLGVTSRGGRNSGAPTSPVSRLTSGALDPHAGARSFISNLHALSFHASNDSDAMTSAFLKLEATNMSTNQSIEGYLNQAKHFLREAAFKIERALSKQNPDSLLQQADQLEQQAAAMVRGALEESGQSGGKLSALMDEMEHGDGVSGGTSVTDQVAAEAWQHIYDSADRAIREAALAFKEEDDAKAGGDSAAAAAAHERGDKAEARARTMLEAAGITVSTRDAQAIGQLALQMEAAGDHTNVMTKYLDLHPEKAQGLLPAEIYDQVKDKGGQAIVSAIMQHQASQGDAMSLTSLGLASSAADQQALSEIQGQFPEAAAIQGVLGQAAEMLKQAYELRMRAYMMKEALLDAQNAIHEGKTDDGEFGVQRRNMVAQNEIMRGLSRLLGGSRADRQAREDANLEARRARPEVVQLMRDFVERDHSSAIRRGTSRA